MCFYNWDRELSKSETNIKSGSGMSGISHGLQNKVHKLQTQLYNCPLQIPPPTHLYSSGRRLVVAVVSAQFGPRPGTGWRIGEDAGRDCLSVTGSSCGFGPETTGRCGSGSGSGQTGVCESARPGVLQADSAAPSLFLPSAQKIIILYLIC